MLTLADNLKIPVHAVTEKIAFLGRTGTGKTYAAMKLAEQMLEADAQIVVLDAVGKWYGLRVAGAGPGFAIPVFGGLNGDFPLESTGGKLMADLVVDRAISTVIDVSQFTKGEQNRFALDFGTQFYQRKKALPSAVHIFLEECQEFLPQNPLPGEQAMLAAYERLWKLGRNFGIGGSLISQRPQEVNKKALNQTGTLFVFGMTGPQERKAIEQWVSAQGINEDIRAILPTLQQGQPHVWSPTFLSVSKTVRIGAKRTADVSSTPKVGSRAKEKPLTPIDAKDLSEQMAATVERAKAEDPRELRKQLADVRQQLAKAQTATPLNQQASAAPGKPVLTEADRVVMVKLREQINKIQQLLTVNLSLDLSDVLARLEKRIAQFKTDFLNEQSDASDAFIGRLEAKGFQKILDKLASVPVPHDSRYHADTRTVPPPARSLSATRPNETRAPRVARLAEHNGHDLGRVHRAFLTVLANRKGKATRRNQLAVFSGYSAKSRHVDNTISALRASGYLQGSRDSLAITASGIGALGTWDELPSGRALIDYWVREVGTAPGAMLRALVDVYPKTMTRDEVADASNYSVTSRHVDNSLSYLRTLELISGERAALRASEELFV